MTITNQSLITQALQRIGVVDETQAPTTTQSNNALAIMNQHLAFKQALGTFRVGWYPQTSLTANAPLRDEYVEPVILILCGKFSMTFGQPIQDPILAQQITDAEPALSKLTRLNFDSDLSELSRAQGAPWGGPGWGI